MQVIVEGLLTHYERKGNGRVVLIVPGWADTSKSWLPIQTTLSTDFDCIVVDIPGFGGSQQPPVAWGLSEYVDFLVSFLAKVQVTDVYALVGHSNGGAMAIRAAASAKIKPTKLVLVASAGIRAGQDAKKRTFRLFAKGGKALMRPLPKALQDKARQTLYTQIGSDLLVAEHMQETFKKIVEDDVQADAARIKIPTHLMYGDADDQTPLEFGQKFQSLIAGSTLRTFTGAGHFLHVDKPAELSAEIQEFLK